MQTVSVVEVLGAVIFGNALTAWAVYVAWRLNRFGGDRSTILQVLALSGVVIVVGLGMRDSAQKAYAAAHPQQIPTFQSYLEGLRSEAAASSQEQPR